MFIFAGFAYYTPMTSKLYKELAYSGMMGAVISYQYVLFYKRIYLASIEEHYDKLKSRFASNPILSTIKEDEQIIKNFGFNRHADTDDEDEDEDELGLDKIGIFDGDVRNERQEIKDKLIANFYGY